MKVFNKVSLIYLLVIWSLISSDIWTKVSKKRKLHSKDNADKHDTLEDDTVFDENGVPHEKNIKDLQNHLEDDNPYEELEQRDVHESADDLKESSQMNSISEILDNIKESSDSADSTENRYSFSNKYNISCFFSSKNKS